MQLKLVLIDHVCHSGFKLKNNNPLSILLSIQILNMSPNSIIHTKIPLLLMSYKSNNNKFFIYTEKFNLYITTSHRQATTHSSFAI